MRKSQCVVMCVFLCLFLLSGSGVKASEGLAAAWQMDYGESACPMLLAAAQDCTLCHTSIPAVNSYGQEIVNFGFGWFVIEGLDSDGDGRTSGEEIYSDCSLPGDIASPAESSSWSRIKALYSK